MILLSFLKPIYTQVNVITIFFNPGRGIIKPSTPARWQLPTSSPLLSYDLARPIRYHVFMCTTDSQIACSSLNRGSTVKYLVRSTLCSLNLVPVCKKKQLNRSMVVEGLKKEQTKTKTVPIVLVLKR